MLATIVLVLVIGVIATICGILLIDFYLSRKRIDTNEAIMRVGGEMERYTDHMMEKMTTELTKWYNDMMKKDSEGED